MEKEIVWTAQARANLEEVYLYLLDNFGTQVVDKFLNDIEKKTLLIQKMPSLYPQIPDFEGVSRCLVNKNVSLYYKVLELKISIIALVDNRRNPDTLANILK
jgi:plasmid stabilization system protein ParE